VSGDRAASGALAPIFDLLEDGVGRAYPGAVLEVLYREEVVIRRAVGLRSRAPAGQPATVETVYDLASLTKVVVTTPLLLQAAAEKRLRLDDPLAMHLPEARAPAVTLGHLLSHTSGLPAWIPFYLEATGYEAVVARAAATLPTAPAGEQVVYSDLGFILLGEIVRRALGSPLDVLAEQRVFGPLEMRDTTYRPPSSRRDRIAPTEDGTAIEQAMAGQAGRRHRWRRYLIWGEVHDSNAYAMGGVSGHSGVFGTADDVIRYARTWLAGGRGSRASVLPAELVQAATTGQPPDQTRGLGWALTGPHGWWGTALSPRAFGHTGFTGTSIVIDPEHALAIVLLTNAVHLGRDRTEILGLRRELAVAVARALALGR
jgi:CubicO group peptidase (beta-lactamase class C family)